jgi:hypothetical protein
VFFLKHEKLDFEVPALSLSGLLITKLISFRENDIIDVVSILIEKSDDLNSQELYYKALQSGNHQAIQRRLNELREFFESGEIDAIWYIWLKRMLPAEVKAKVLDKIKKLLKPFIISY